MIKKRSVILLFVMLILFISACSSESSTGGNLIENKITLSEDKGDTSGNSIVEIIFADNTVDYVLDVVNENVVYCHSDSDSEIHYYLYDMDANLTYDLGSIKNPFIYSGSMTQIGECLYFYMSEVIYSDENSSEELEVTLYEIDTKNKILKSIYTDNVDQTLVYVDEYENGIMAFMGQIQNEIGITYIDYIKINNTTLSEFNRETIISLDYDNSRSIGILLYGFSQFDGYIYTIEATSEKIDSRTLAIRQYDHTGNVLKEINLDNSLVEMLSNERISKFVVLGQYAFVRTFSGSGAIFDISGEVTTTECIGMQELDIAFEKDSTHALFFNRNTGEIWLLDIAKSVLCELQSDHDFLNYILTSDDGNILIVTDIYEYLDYMELPQGRSWFFEDDIIKVS